MLRPTSFLLTCAILGHTAGCGTYYNESVLNEASKTYRQSIAAGDTPTDAQKKQIKQFEELLRQNLSQDKRQLREDEAARRLDALFPPGEKAKRVSEDDLNRLLDNLGAPASYDAGFLLLMAHCLKMEKEKESDLNLYRRSRWSTLVIGAASASTATVLTGVNDSNNATITPTTHERLRISALVFGAAGVLLSAVYGLVGFEDRITRSQNDLVAIRRAIGNARAKWPATAKDDTLRVNVLLDMMSNCNSNSISERELMQARTQSLYKQTLTASVTAESALTVLGQVKAERTPNDATKLIVKNAIDELTKEVTPVANSVGGPVGRKLEDLVKEINSFVETSDYSKLSAKITEVKDLLEKLQKQGDK